MTNKPSIRKLIKKSAFIFSLSFIFLLASCEGFFTNNDLDVKIKDAIAYANAPVSSFFISADAKAGTIRPIGKISYKPTDYQNIKFELNPEYEFINWNFRYEEIQSGEKYTREITNKNWWKDYIDIVSEEISEPDSNGKITYTLQIQFKKPEENMLIEPVCSLKPVIKTFTPGYELKGVSRESQISVEFNSPINQDTLFFSQAEIDAIADVTNVLKNDDKKIYGYEKASKRYYKNIEILMGNADVDINDFYGDFQYRQDINTLFISAKKAVEIVGEVAEVKVHFKDGIKNTDGASMTDIVKTFCVNKSSNQKAIVDIKFNDNIPVQRSTIDAFMEQEISFPEDLSLQFLYWKIEANDDKSKGKITVYNDTDKEITMKFCANATILQSEGVKISAVYKKRPAIVSEGFSPKDSNGGVAKDSEIKIIFDQEINLQSFISGYKISCGGNDVKENFKTPKLDTTDPKILIISSDPENTIDVDKDSTKKVTVTIPASLYYIADVEGTEYQIQVGEDISRSYKINSSTYDQATINFSVDDAKVTVSGIKAGNAYNTDDAFSLVVNEKDGYKFVGWKKTGDTENKIQITQSEANPNLWNFKITGKCGSTSSPVKIEADVRDRLKVEKIEPGNNEEHPCDTGITVYFNKAPANKQDCIDKISITCDGRDVKDDYFPITGWGNIVETSDTSTGKTLYSISIPANRNNRIPVNGTATIEIVIDKDLSYKDTDNKVISLSETKNYIYRYKINDETTDKVILQLDTEKTKGTLANAFEPEYSIGKLLAVAFTPDEDYEFLYWETDFNNISFADKYQKNTNIIINSANSSGTTKIWPKTIEKLKVTALKIYDASDLTTPVEPDSNGVAKDSVIGIEFNKAPSDKINIRNSIELTIGTTDVYSNYIVSLNDKKLTFTPRTDNRIQIDSVQNLSLKIMPDFYYENTDGIVPKIYMKEADSRIIKISPNTNTKATVGVTVENGQGTMKDGNGNAFNLGSKDYNLDATFTLNFTPSDNYEFIRWLVTGTSGNVNLSSLTNTNTTVTVNNAAAGEVQIKPLCAPKLKVNSFKVNDVDYTSGECPKDSSITIELSQTPSGNLSLKNYITITGDGQDVSSKFIQTISDNVITFSENPSDRFKITQGTTKTVDVKVLTNVYYEFNGTEKIYLTEPYEKHITLNSATQQKAKVKIEYDSDTYGTVKNAAGDSYSLAETSYNKDQELTLKFTPTTDYEFIEWEVTGVEDNVILSSYTATSITVKIDDAQSGTTTIKPLCAEKLKVESMTVNGSTFSDTSTTTYPKDSVIVLNFNKSIPSGLILSNYITLSCGNIANVPSYYKITSSGSSITLTPLSRLGITSNETLNLTVSGSLYYEYTSTKNVTLASSVTKAIPLNTTTVQKAKVQVTNGNNSAGTIKDGSTGNNFTTAETQYSKDQTFTLNYDLNSAYEFINWTVTSSSGSTAANNVRLSSTTSPTTTVTIIGSATGTATIKANVAPKLALESMTVNGEVFNESVTTATYPKDSVIVLNFNKNIPSDLTLSDYITLSCGSIANVPSYYTITSSGSSITLTPLSRLGITSNETLNLTVKSSLYYEYTSTKNITLASSVTKAIPLNTTTVQKATVKVTNGNTSAGTIKDGSTGNNFTTAETQYSKDQTFTLNYALNSGYEFINWTVTESATGAASNVELSNENSPTTTVTIKDSASGTATITANVVPKLKVTSFKLTNNSGTNAPVAGVTYEKDCDIVIEFNETPYYTTDNDGNVDDTNITKNINIYCNGKDVTRSFDPIISGKTITYTANANRISVTSTSTVSVEIQDGIYYKSGLKSVYMANQQQYSYQIDKTTREQATVYIGCDFPAYGKLYKSDGTEFTNGVVDYNKDEKINVKFVPNDDYVFVDWEIYGWDTDAYDSDFDADCVENVSVDATTSTDITITIENAISGTVYIKPRCTPYIAVSELLIQGQQYYQMKEYAKDSSIKIKFNKKLDPVTNGYDPIKNKIKLCYQNSNNDITDKYTYTRTDNSGVTVIDFTADKKKLVDVRSTDLIFICIDKDVSYNYYYSNSTEKKQITMKNKYEQYFRINNETNLKYKIIKETQCDEYPSEQAAAAELIEIYPYREDGLYNWGEEITAKFPIGTQNYYQKEKVSHPATDLYGQDGWEILKGPENNSNINGEITSFSNDADYCTVKFKIYNAYNTNSGNNPASIRLLMKVLVKPQLKSVYPVTTNEVKTYPCDTPIIMKFTHEVDKTTPNLNGYSGNIRVVRATAESGNLSDGIQDISSHFYMKVKEERNDETNGVYFVEVMDGEPDTLIIRPKSSIMNLFTEIKKEKETIYVLALQNANTAIKSTSGKWLFLNIPPAMNDRLSSVTIEDKNYCCIPMTIESTVSNPHFRIRADESHFYQKSSKLTSNVPPTFNSNLVFDKDAFPNGNVGTNQVWLVYGPDKKIIGDFSDKDFNFDCTITADITKVQEYNKTTGKLDMYEALGMNGDHETKRVSLYSAIEVPSDGFECQNLLLKINLEELGYSHSDQEHYPILRIDVTVSSPLFVYPFTTCYYILYGAK